MVKATGITRIQVKTPLPVSTTASLTQQPTKPFKRSLRKIVVDVSMCRYAIIKRCLKERGFSIKKAISIYIYVYV